MKYSEDFKQTLVLMHQNGKSLRELHNFSGVSISALSRWIVELADVEIANGKTITIQQIKGLQKNNKQLEAENLILKKMLILINHPNCE